MRVKHPLILNTRQSGMSTFVVSQLDQFVSLTVQFIKLLIDCLCKCFSPLKSLFKTQIVQLTTFDLKQFNQLVKTLLSSIAATFSILGFQTIRYITLMTCCYTDLSDNDCCAVNKKNYTAVLGPDSRAVFHFNKLGLKSLSSFNNKTYRIHN